MTPFFVRLFLLCTLPFFCACQPLVTPDVQHKMKRIYVQPIAEHSGQKMRHSLENLMQTDGKNPLYILCVKIKTWDQIRVFGKSGKSIVNAEKSIAHYTLKQIKDNKTLLESSRQIRSIRPFTRSPYAQTIATEHQLDQSLDMIAHDIVRHIAQTLRNTSPSVS
jgi:hypothetical protein